MPINSTHPSYEAMLPKWTRCRDAASGQDAVHAAGEAYLPRLADQEDEDYKKYLKRAGFYNAFWRTLSGLTGMVLRQEPVVEVPSSVEHMLEDINMAGVPLVSFAQTVLEEALQQGRVGVLVDSPPVRSENGTPTLADAIAQNIRPSLQIYRAESVINWKSERVNNVMALTLVVLKESEQVAVDDYSAKGEDRWRELTLGNGVYRQRVFRKGVNDFEQIGDDVFPKMNNLPMAYIPFLFISADDLTPDVDDPPLIDLVDVNLAHYRVTADYEHGCHFTGLPTPVISGYVKNDPSEKLYVGSSHAWVFPEPGAHASYLEFSGQGLSALTENLSRKEQQMAILGARMLEPQLKGGEAADSGSIRRKGEESMLAATAKNVSRGLTICLRWLTEWAGADPEQVEFEFNHDFYPVPMTTAMISTIMSGWQSGLPGFSDQGVFGMLQKGEVIPKGVTLEEEQARISDRQIEIGQQSAFTGG